MNISTNTGTTTYKEVMDALTLLTRPKNVVAQVGIVGNPVRQNVALRQELPDLEQVEFDHLNPNRVASIYGKNIVVQDVDHPKMQVSPEFARLQSPELVNKTNLWMRDFFGMVCPVYQMGDNLIMSQTTFQQLRLALHK